MSRKRNKSILNIDAATIQELKKDWDINFIYKDDKGVYLNDQFDFSIETKRKIEDSIKEYQAGNTFGAEYLISVFDPFLRMIVEFLCNHKMVIYSFKNGIHIINKEIYKIVGLFIKNVGPGQKIKAFQRTCVDIKYLLNDYTQEEIYNELVCALLIMAKRYKIRTPQDIFYKDGGSFYTYIDRCFHFEVFNILKKLTKPNITTEPLHHHKLNLFSENTFDVILNEVESFNRLSTSNKIIFKEQNSNPYDDESLNLNWINGITCSEGFISLSPYERKLLVMSYKNKMTDKRVALEMGYKKNTIAIHRRNAIKKIK